MCSAEQRCLIPPSPQLRARIKEELARVRADSALIGPMVRIAQPKSPGLNDGLIVPGDYFPIGTPLERVKAEAAERAPLRGAVRVVVVLVDFADQPMDPGHNLQHFQDLFFSRGVLQNGSVREYFAEASHGLIDIAGEVVGPYRLPRTLAEYAHGQSGTGTATPNARTMARHAAEAANPLVNFAPYDNDGNGFVDAFIVIHAGGGAEVTGNANEIWSHKWVLSNGEYNADGTRIYAYLTVPEDAKIGVCAHELGHLLFGWPDLYDIDGSSEGVGNWCLMAGGSWNGSGEVPAHPSAWCKAEQGWVSVINQASNATLNIADVKDAHTVYRLWKDGAKGKEYFLVENRQRRLYDRLLPGEGLLVFHIDDGVGSNEDERHPKVGLLQADGADHLNQGINRGDPGDAYPGTTNARSWTATTTPNSKAYGGVTTGVTITDIANTGAIMSVKVTVKAATTPKKPKRPWFFDWFHFVQSPEGAAMLGRYAGQPKLLKQMVAQIEAMAAGQVQTGVVDNAWMQSVDQRLEVIENMLSLLRPDGDVGAGMYSHDDDDRDSIG